MLTCMVTCRCTDKKPCDNIVKEPITASLVSNSISIGGKKIKLFNDPIKANITNLGLNSADSLVCKDLSATLTELEDPIGKGKLCPFVR